MSDETDESQERQAEKIRQARELAHSDFKWLMSNKRGRRIVWRLLESSGVFHTSFTSDALQMSFNEGRRNYGLGVLGKVHELTPELYPVMLKEHKEKDA